MTSPTDARDRLLRDPTAAAELLAWARRHDDAYAEAIALARLGPEGVEHWPHVFVSGRGDDDRRWARIKKLAARLDDEVSLARLDAELSGWPDEMRRAPLDWAWPFANARMRLGRTFQFNDCELEPEHEALVAWLGSSQLASLTALDLEGQRVGDDGLEVLCASPHASKLTRLELFYTGITNAGLTALPGATFAGRLRVLGLGSMERNVATSDVPLGRVLAERLDAVAHPAGLERLGLDDSGLEDEDLPVLLESRAIQGIYELNLFDNGTLRDAAARHIANAPSLGSLQTLRLHGTSISTRGLDALCRSPSLSSLSALSLPQRLEGADVLRALTDATFVDNLRELDIDSSMRGCAGALIAFMARAHLRRLNLSGSRLDKTTVREVAEQAHLDGLEHISLGCADGLAADDLVALLEAIPGDGLSVRMSGRRHDVGRSIEPLIASPALRRVCELNLFGNSIGDDGVRLLARSPHACNLEVLELVNNGVGPDGITALAESPYLTRLRRLDLGDPGDEGVERLLAHPDLAKITRLWLGGGRDEQRLNRWHAAMGWR